MILCDRCTEPLTWAESVECRDQIGDLHHPCCCPACNDARAQDRRVEEAMDK